MATTVSLPHDGAAAWKLACGSGRGVTSDHSPVATENFSTLASGEKKQYVGKDEQQKPPTAYTASLGVAAMVAATPNQFLASSMGATAVQEFVSPEKSAASA